MRKYKISKIKCRGLSPLEQAAFLLPENIIVKSNNNLSSKQLKVKVNKLLQENYGVTLDRCVINEFNINQNYGVNTKVRDGLMDLIAVLVYEITISSNELRTISNDFKQLINLKALDAGLVITEVLTEKGYFNNLQGNSYHKEELDDLKLMLGGLPKHNFGDTYNYLINYIKIIFDKMLHLSPVQAKKVIGYVEDYIFDFLNEVIDEYRR